jgi:hypothetical protein
MRRSLVVAVPPSIVFEMVVAPNSNVHHAALDDGD